MLIQEEPINDYDKNMLGLASYIGIESSKLFLPIPEQKVILQKIAKDAQNHRLLGLLYASRFG
jgi:hypothetical protein